MESELSFVALLVAPWIIVIAVLWLHRRRQRERGPDEGGTR